MASKRKRRPRHRQMGDELCLKEVMATTSLLSFSFFCFVLDVVLRLRAGNFILYAISCKIDFNCTYFNQYLILLTLAGKNEEDQLSFE